MAYSSIPGEERTTRNSGFQPAPGQVARTEFRDYWASPGICWHSSGVKKEPPWASRFLITGLLLLVSACLRAEAPFPILFRDPGLFRNAIAGQGAPDLCEPAASVSGTPFLREPAASVSGTLSEQGRITGLVLPHHLLAAHLIARGLWPCRGWKYDRIVIISPDHFRRGRKLVSVTARDFRTCLGPVRTDRGAIERLLEDPRVCESSLFSHEHGIQALLPFLAQMFTGTPVVPVAVRPVGKAKFRELLSGILDPIISSETLVIQSTDFSHHLPPGEARLRDLESLRIIAQEDPDRVFSLRQPSNVDSLGAMHLQMKIQRDLFRARPCILANCNSVEFMPEGVSEREKRDSTSYIVCLYWTGRKGGSSRAHTSFHGTCPRGLRPSGQGRAIRGPGPTLPHPAVRSGFSATFTPSWGSKPSGIQESPNSRGIAGETPRETADDGR